MNLQAKASARRRPRRVARKIAARCGYQHHGPHVLLAKVDAALDASFSGFIRSSSELVSELFRSMLLPELQPGPPPPGSKVIARDA